jgi:hypothetical protein
MMQHIAFNANIDRANTNYDATLNFTTLYRIIAGGFFNIGLNARSNSSIYEAVTGKVAFVDHGWEMQEMANPRMASEPVEASLNPAGTNPNNVPYSQPWLMNSLRAQAGRDANGAWTFEAP